MSLTVLDQKEEEDEGGINKLDLMHALFEQAFANQHQRPAV